MNSFGHAGESGDLIYCLPTMRALGGGELLLHAFVDGLPARPRGFSEKLYHNIAPLLKCQSYIKSLSYSQLIPFVDYDLNQFRNHWSYAFIGEYRKRRYDTPNIAQMCRVAFELEDESDEIPWLTVPSPCAAPKGVLVNRSLRYHNPAFPWPFVMKKYEGDIQFIGTREEHQAFSNLFGPIPWKECADLLAVAQAIDECELFIGNQSCPCAIAEGLKKTLWQETYPEDRNCMFNRKGAKYFI
jgi:hypothetical protein